MTIPRLTRFGRRMAAIAGTPVGACVRLSRPSPAEKLRQRKLARAAAKRWRATLQHAWNLSDKPIAQHPSFPLPRGTTHGQLLQMQYESEQP